MPRAKVLPDAVVLAAAMDLIRTGGPEALTFASLAGKTGLSPATLVQRFRSKADLKRAALLTAWNVLEERTRRLIAESPRTPAGAVRILAGLSGDYGEIEAYAEGLLILREDLRDPALRERGARWKAMLTKGLDACFSSTPGAPRHIGVLLASQWQGSLLWWGFEPTTRVDLYVARELRRFLTSIVDYGHA